MTENGYLLRITMAGITELLTMRALVYSLLSTVILAFNCTAWAEERAPNIVIILADDLGWADMQMYDGWLKTPHIEKMAAEGMMFTDFHANSSVCSPTRTAFLTGRYQQRAGIVDVIVGSKEPDQGIPASTPTIAKVFKKNGYATALFGKWHCGYEDKYNPVHHGFDEFVGLLNGGADYHKHENWRNGLKKENVEGYSTDIITDKSIDFIKRNKEKPFFLYVAHQAPHNPYQTREDTPENRKEGWKQNKISDENRPRYKEIVKDLDDSVGKILDALKQNGLDKNTLVFFWSDNGDVSMSPEERPLRGRKFSQYEGGHRVPAVAWWPGQIEAGTKSTALLAGFDLFPTLTEIADISNDNPDNLDGISFKDHLLQNEPVTIKRPLFFGYEPKLGTAMRLGNMKMIVKEKDVQFYDLSSDLQEATNITGKHPDVEKHMREAIEEFKKTVLKGS